MGMCMLCGLEVTGGRSGEVMDIFTEWRFVLIGDDAAEVPDVPPKLVASFGVSKKFPG